MSDDPRTEILDKLVVQVGKQLSADVAADTPLVSSGLLKSMETAWLLAYVQREFGVRVPLSELSTRNFETLEIVADLVMTLRVSAE